MYDSGIKDHDLLILMSQYLAQTLIAKNMLHKWKLRIFFGSEVVFILYFKLP